MTESTFRGSEPSRRKHRTIALTSLGVTLHERIALVPSNTHAHRRMADHSAVRVNAAGSRTRIAALLIDACQVRGAFAVTNALRPAVGRFADKLSQTTARGRVVYNLTSTVESARRRDAGVNGCWRLLSCSGRELMQRSSGEKYHARRDRRISSFTHVLRCTG